jgi:hypothetical protein
MAPTAKGRYNQSRSNQTTHFGIMGGLAPVTNVAAGVHRFVFRRARNKQTIPLSPAPGLEYMKEHDILSKNPAGSGGVGLSKVLVDRAMGPCNCGAPEAQPAPSSTEAAGESCPTGMHYHPDHAKAITSGPNMGCMQDADMT